MVRYKVILSKTAEKELKKLPDNIIKRIVPALKKLETNPKPKGCKKLLGFTDKWRIRVGDYRIIYDIQDKQLIIDVIRIAHRGSVYDA